MELGDPKDLRARIRKFLILTNERKKMSIKTLRKHIAVTATTALLVGVLSAMNTSVANAATSTTHPNAGTAQSTEYSGSIVTNATTTGSMMVATGSNTTTGATVSSALDTETTTMGATCDLAENDALSKGLLQKDTSSGIAQTATVLAGGVLSLYSCTATAVSFKASAGSFVAYGLGNTGWSYNSSNTQVWSPINLAATAVAALWTAPSTVGTYTVSLYAGYYTNSTGAQVISTAALGVTPPILAANITVSVVAASTGGTYAATESSCQAVRGTTASVSSNVDTAGPTASGESWSIDFALNDAYGKNLPASTALVATATNGALLAFGSAGSTPVAGTTSTIVTSSEGDDDTIRVSQPTAGAPLTTTVTLSANGTVVCTKTVSIAGTVAALTIPAANIAVQDLSQASGSNAWFAGDTRTGTFYVVATDSVGNRLTTPSTLGTYGVDSATLGTTVTAVTFGSGDLATSTSSSSPLSATVGNHTCSATAGTQTGVKINFTLANGTVITSAPINLICANDAATYTASFDKAKYVSGDVAKLTVSFKDSKGFAANNVDQVGGHTVVVPGMTLVSASGAATAVPKAGSKLEYTFTVGQTAGKYAAVVDFTGGTTELATYATVQNPSYEITSGGDTTSNADVLKSIVALIASINKQIQALQKLILKR